MKLLLEIRDDDIGEKSKRVDAPKRRDAARAVLIKGDKIALLHVAKEGYHKIPGGGLERGETIEEALERELLEETGCKARIISELGKIIEHRTHFDLIQTSYCYLAEIIKEGPPDFDEGERAAGYALQWVKIDDAIDLISNEHPKDYEGKFIVRRDVRLLKAAKSALG